MKKKQLRFDFREPPPPDLRPVFADLDINQKINLRACIMAGYPHSAWYYNYGKLDHHAMRYANGNLGRWFEHHRINNFNRNLDFLIPVGIARGMSNRDKEIYIVEQRRLKNKQTLSDVKQQKLRLK